jgi:RNA polymerase sigma factor (sigma-70 family)
MRVVGTIETSLVAAAQAGDRHALDELVATSLPLVYSIVRRALNAHSDADDVVQDIMVRALRQLPALRRPESFRSWLAAIAVHQISTHLRRRAAGERRGAPLDEAAGMPDPAGEFEDLTMLEVELSAQRRQVVRAGQWLDPDDRVLLSLWLLENVGELTRADVAAALGTSVAHTGVRIQRMRQQLDLSRELVAALDARPRCAGLEAAIADGDGIPTPLWRKRLIRHVRSCHVCGPSVADMIPAERLLPSLSVLLPVPVGLAAAIAGKAAATTTALAVTSSAALAGGSSATSSVGLKAGFLSQLAQSIVAHPIVATVAAGALAAGTAVTVTNLPTTAPPSRGINAAPAVASPERATPSSAPRVTATHRPSTATAKPPATAIVSPTPGQSVSLESADEPGLFVTTSDDLGILAPIQFGSTLAVRRQATFTAIVGLAKPSCFSFRAQNGRYLRHASWRFRLDPNQGTPLFRSDATFCFKNGAVAGSIVLEASNYPGWYLHHRGNELWVDQANASTTFRAETSFRLRPALAK